jgi:hypothetical protein
LSCTGDVEEPTPLESATTLRRPIAARIRQSSLDVHPSGAPSPVLSIEYPTSMQS